MKHKRILITSCLFIVGSASNSFAAYTLANGDFAGNVTTGWTTSGTVSAASGAAVLSASATIYQDFSSGATPTTGNNDFQLDFSFSVSSITSAQRIRLRGNGYAGGNNTDGDIITLRLNASSIDRFNSIDTSNTLITPAWGSALTGITINTNTTYWLRVIGTDLDASTRSYTVGFSTNGTTYATSAAITAFHAAPYPADFETIGFESGAGSTMTVDNITVVPEPNVAALLGGLGMFALLRRRRQ